MRSALVLLFVAVGCSSGSVQPVTTAPDAQPADTGASCGTRVGDVLCDLDLQGYVRDATDGLASAATPGGSKTSEALAIGRQRYAFIFTTAFW